MSNLVGTPEDWFSRVAALILYSLQVAKKGTSHTKEINHAKKRAMEALEHSLQARFQIIL